MTIIQPLPKYGILSLLIIIAACSKENNNNTEPSLTGNWKWVRTDGGIANNIHETPASTGKNIELRFTNDNKYLIYINGTLASQGTYTLETQNCIHDHSDKKVINFSSPSEADMMLEKIDNTGLELSDNAYDGTGSVYTRQ